MARPKVSCPHLGSYYVPMEYFFRRGLDVDYVVPPPVTARTVALGCGASPPEACMPFKITLGTYLEAIEAGADTLVATGGICRLSFFGTLQEQILRDLGKKVRFHDIQPDYFRVETILRELRKINPDAKLRRVIPAFITGLKMAEAIEEAEDYVNANYGFAEDRDALLERTRLFLEELRQAGSYSEVRNLRRRCMKELGAIPVRRPERPLRVGVIGEFYTLLDPASNHYIEKTLGGMGVEMHRFLNVTNALVRYPAKTINRISMPYMEDSCGVTTRVTVGSALLYAREGYDGIIHVKSFGCMPEVDATAPLQDVSRDHDVPLLFLSYDALTEDAGLCTRLEAFYDMLCMRRWKKSCATVT